MLSRLPSDRISYNSSQGIECNFIQIAIDVRHDTGMKYFVIQSLPDNSSYYISLAYANAIANKVVCLNWKQIVIVIDHETLGSKGIAMSSCDVEIMPCSQNLFIDVVFFGEEALARWKPILAVGIS